MKSERYSATETFMDSPAKATKLYLGRAFVNLTLLLNVKLWFSMNLAKENLGAQN